MAQEYKNVNENYGDPVACTYEELCDVLRMFQADDPTINGRHLVVAGDAVVELSHDDPLHREVIAKEYSIDVTPLETDELHPLWRQYDGQLTTQPAFIEFDSRDNTLTADYCGEVGGGVPADVWHGIRWRLPISPQLTCSEINTLLADVAAALGQDCDKADVERLCAERLTTSNGVLPASDWFRDLDVPKKYLIDADTTDYELELAGLEMVDDAQYCDTTITGVSDYCEHLRDDVRRSKEAPAPRRTRHGYQQRQYKRREY